MMRQLHLWVGLLLGVFILVIAVSGTLLLARAPLLVLEHPQLRDDDGPQTPLSVVLEKITAAVGDGRWTFISFPRDNNPAYEVGMAEGARLLFTRHGEGPLASGFAGHPSFVHWLHDMHVQLVAGDMGENVAGVAGVGLLVLGVSGLIVWWPYRSRTAPKDLVLRGISRPKLMRWHWTAGFVFSGMMMLLAFTGVMMSFHGTGQRALQNAAGVDMGAGVMSAVSASGVPPGHKVDWTVVIAAAQAVFPDDRLGLLSAPRQPSAPYVFRTHRDGEWNVIGRSLIAVDVTTAKVLASWSARDIGAVGTAVTAFFPLHAGQVGHTWYVLLIALTGLAIIGLSVSGLVAYLRRPAPATADALTRDPATV